MATVEYAALVVLVSLVTAAGATAVGGERIALGVAAQARRALCVVQGGDCHGPGGPRPCVVRADTSSRDRRVSIVVLRLGDGRSVVREVRSDGSVVVTVLLSDQVGAGAVWGARGTWRGRGVQANAEASVSARGGFARRYVVPDGAAADRLITRLRDEDPPVGGAVAKTVGFLLGREDAAEERLVTFGVRGEASGALEALGLKAQAAALGDSAAGVRVNRRTGERSVVLQFDRGLEAELGAPLGLRAGMGRALEVRAEMAFDRQGQAVSLTLAATGAIRGELAAGGLESGGGDRLDAEARLDLADPTARALLADVLARVRSGDGSAMGPARALGARIAERARIDVRAYATDRSERISGGRAAYVAELGYEKVDVVESARLVAAYGREPGGPWTRRLDCLVSA